MRKQFTISKTVSDESNITSITLHDQFTNMQEQLFSTVFVSCHYWNRKPSPEHQMRKYIETSNIVIVRCLQIRLKQCSPAASLRRERNPALCSSGDGILLVAHIPYQKLLSRENVLKRSIRLSLPTLPVNIAKSVGCRWLNFDPQTNASFYSLINSTKHRYVSLFEELQTIVLNIKAALVPAKNPETASMGT